MTTLKKGDKAPDFEGINQNGQKVSLTQFKGKKLILYFYPKDDTPGCTAEACNLNDNYNSWIEKGFEVVGVSPDDVKSHLKFNLVADTDQEILKKYGAWGEKSMYGKKYMGVLRTTFVIDGDGTIVEVIEKVDTKNHTSQIVESLNL